MRQEIEIWRPIDGHYGYEVSSCGNVRSFRNPNGKGFVNYYKYLKQYIKRDYFNVSLDGKFYRVHRLVAQAFIPNPHNLPMINHKNENKTDNRVENLEWCDAKYNVNYGTAMQRASATKKKKFSHDKKYREGMQNRARINGAINAKKVICLDTGVIYNSIQECCKANNISRTHLRRMCNHIKYSSKGLHFAYYGV